jgi:hypothetical protein
MSSHAIRHLQTTLLLVVFAQTSLQRAADLFEQLLSVLGRGSGAPLGHRCGEVAIFSIADPAAIAGPNLPRTNTP